MLTVAEARNLILQQSRSFGTETILLSEAYDRVLAEDIYADRDYPPFNRSAMDGYALQLKDIEKYTEFKLVAEMLAGESIKILTEEGTCIKIMTGAPVPEGANLVIRVEDSELNNDIVKFKSLSSKIWQNIALQGEDAKIGELVLKRSTIINASTSGLLASLGRNNVTVCSLPKVSIVSTGNEIKAVGDSVLPHQIRDSNSYTIASFFQHYNIDIASRKLVSDRKEEIKHAIESSKDMDILILSGGVSMGDADFVPEVLNECGVKTIFHKVQIKPGKPLWFGIRDNQTVVFALPGNPVSCQVAFKVFIEPFLRACFGLPLCQTIKLAMTSDRRKKSSFEEYFPCILAPFGLTTGLQQIKNNGSGDFTSITRSSGLAVHPAEIEQLKEGDVVEFIPWKGV
ncbi:MAG: molybdopterin molybdotransferase MoeA [Sporocytophaga sp.]|uniref:molybdopterin molybdotransferase MoeA n=1 Tax=Sporocytophaga sp. TaxID=2231183 RepID=UPI001B09440B|nr:gephyrin-like molybdotransferase Glp [Sporocytophaga sp.]MBO9699328.1 molybdopterin molybdotransferase MoeA [Sporocytophaga sp.]